MCLGTKLSDRSLRRYKAKGKKRGYIRVWKTVRMTGKKFRPSSYSGSNSSLYQKGLNKARTDARSENQIIHAFCNRSSAKKWLIGGEVIVSAMVPPDWIKAIGKSGSKLTLTTKAIVMPEYPKRRVTVREFRAAIKGEKVKTYSWES